VKPVIAIASEEIRRPSLSAFPYSWYITNDAYTTAIERAGGIPFILPPSKDAISLISKADGLLLQGGADVSPSLYKEEKRECCGECNEEEDLFHIALVKKTERQGKPIFGICRGLQLINVAFGGSLYQDRREGNFEEHTRKDKFDSPIHKVKLLEGSFLSELFETDCLKVNSLHHQMIKTLAPCFKASAISEDGVIEAIERGNIRGVQWHPEAMLAKEDAFLPLFSTFIELC